MIALSLVFGLMLCILLLCFGRAGLKNLATLHICNGWLALCACSLQLANVVLQHHRLELLLATAALLAWFCWTNRRVAGMPLVIVGIVLNLTTMAANGGTMPISPTTLERMSGINVASGTSLRFSKDVVRDPDQSAMSWFGDRFLLPGPLAPFAAWSIGDMLLLIGVWRLFWTTMKGPHRGTTT
jgi:hypothetical protein